MVRASAASETATFMHLSSGNGRRAKFTAFDLGLHVRRGDACGPHAVHQPLRRCHEAVENAMAFLRNVSNASKVAVASGRQGPRIFIATDSDEILTQARALLGDGRVHSLEINRSKYESSEMIEIASHLPDSNPFEVLLESLLDLIFLSSSDNIAGSWLGNFPRVAMQLRVRDTERYITLDRRAWCPITKCANPPPKDSCHEQHEWSSMRMCTA